MYQELDQLAGHASYRKSDRSLKLKYKRRMKKCQVSIRQYFSVSQEFQLELIRTDKNCSEPDQNHSEPIRTAQNLIRTDQNYSEQLLF